MLTVPLIKMRPCSHCQGSGWLDTVRDVARQAIPLAAGVVGGPAAGVLARGAVAMSGLGHARKSHSKHHVRYDADHEMDHSMDGAGKMYRLADGRRVKKLFDRDGKPVELHRPKRVASEAIVQRNQLVRQLMQSEGLSLADASKSVKERGLWPRQ